MGVVQAFSTAVEPMTAKELSISCGGDELLIGSSFNRIKKGRLTGGIVRLMRPLCALGVFRETKGQIQTYESTTISELLPRPPLLGGYQFMLV
jgi:hypothetical protein